MLVPPGRVYVSTQGGCMLVPREGVCQYPGRVYVSTQGGCMLVPREGVC